MSAGIEFPPIPYFTSLTFAFQEYFINHIRRGLEFFVEATVPNLFEYMQTVLSNGSYGEYAYRRLLETSTSRRKLNGCIVFVLDLLQNDNEEEENIRGIVPRKGNVRYYIPRIRDAHLDVMDVSHAIFGALKQAVGYGADEQEITQFLQQKGYPFDMNALLRLFHSNCVQIVIRNHQPIYRINCEF